MQNPQVVLVYFDNNHRNLLVTTKVKDTLLGPLSTLKYNYAVGVTKNNIWVIYS